MAPAGAEWAFAPLAAPRPGDSEALARAVAELAQGCAEADGARVMTLIRRLVPEAECVTRPRFSTLSHTGAKKLTRLPPRSVVVAFSATDVYARAETLRRQCGGAAVVADSNMHMDM